MPMMERMMLFRARIHGIKACEGLCPLGCLLHFDTLTQLARTHLQTLLHSQKDPLTDSLPHPPPLPSRPPRSTCTLCVRGGVVCSWKDARTEAVSIYHPCVPPELLHWQPSFSTSPPSLYICCFTSLYSVLHPAPHPHIHSPTSPLTVCVLPCRPVCCPQPSLGPRC